MSKLLYVESSPRKDRSHSIAVARSFLEVYHKCNPSDTIETWDLWSPAEVLMEFDGPVMTAKYAARGPAPSHTPEEADAWAQVGRHVDRLKSADKLLFSVPMWNFGVPYKFKHFVDIVTQPGLTFRPDPVNGPVGLLMGKKAVVISSSGGVYTPGTPRAAWDMQEPYVKLWLNLIGITDVTSVVLDGTARPEQALAEAKARAIENARAIAAVF
jgi:FMN-dependent NADH-azoreductase